MSLVGLIFRLQVHQAEADATYLLAGTILVTYVLNNVLAHTQHSCDSADLAQDH